MAVRVSPELPPVKLSQRVACVLILLVGCFGIWQTYKAVRIELDRRAREAEIGFRVGGSYGIGTSERSLFAALALQGIVAHEGQGSSAAARREQVEAALRYADLLLELQLKEVAP